MRSREEIEKSFRSGEVDDSVILAEVLLNIRDLLQTLVKGKIQHTVVVKGDGSLSADDIARIRKTVKDAQAEDSQKT